MIRNRDDANNKSAKGKMMQAQVNWKEGMSFTGTADTGFEVPLGASEAVGGANDGFRPLELMLVSLAGCTAMDVLSILRKKRQEVTDFKVSVDADRSDEHQSPGWATRIVSLTRESFPGAWQLVARFSGGSRGAVRWAERGRPRGSAGAHFPEQGRPQ